MCACTRVFYLLFLSEQAIYECMKVPYMLCSRIHASYELVIYIDACYLLYDMLFLLYVFYVELELSLSGGLKSIIVVKASSIFMYTFIIN